jgi:hypothetical protein
VVHSVSDPEMLADILTKCVNPAKFQLCAKGAPPRLLNL